MDYARTAERILELAHDRDSLHRMGELAKTIAVKDSAGQMYREILDLVD